MRPALPALLALSLVSATPGLPHAQANDPAAQQIDAFDHVLLESMKSKAGVQGRYKRLEPAVQRTFNLSAMLRVAVGPAWVKMSASDQAALLQAFTRYSVANYAKNFTGYSGQQFLLGGVDTRGPDKLVHVNMTSGSGAPVVFVYRMREYDGAWKIIDVFFNGSISELSQQASDFSSTVNSGGAPALVKKLNDLSDKLMKS
jgi:phospholipid transport system substrate-binding protein